MAYTDDANLERLTLDGHCGEPTRLSAMALATARLLARKRTAADDWRRVAHTSPWAHLVAMLGLMAVGGCYTIDNPSNGGVGGVNREPSSYGQYDVSDSYSGVDEDEEPEPTTDSSGTASDTAIGTEGDTTCTKPLATGGFVCLQQGCTAEVSNCDSADDCRALSNLLRWLSCNAECKDSALCAEEEYLCTLVPGCIELNNCLASVISDSEPLSVLLMNCLSATPGVSALVDCGKSACDL